MKRLLTLALVVFGLAACQNDPDAPRNNGGEVEFELSVTSADLGTTRAAANGTNDTKNALNSAYGAIDYLQGATLSDELHYDWNDVDLRYTLEVYDNLSSYTGAEPIKKRQVIIVDEYTPVKFSVRLIPDRTYRFVVFADFVDQGATNNPAIETQRDLGLKHIIGDNLGDITIKNDAINDERTDAYFASVDLFISNSAAKNVELKRPYGKLRVVATDLAELNLNVDPTSVEVKYEAFHAAQFNAVTGVIGGEYTEATFQNPYNAGVGKYSLANHVYNAGYDSDYKYINADNETLHTHMTLFTDYILANEDQHDVQFVMNVYDGQKLIKSTDFNTQIPVQRNHLTTIVGNVLTTGTEIMVTIDDNFLNAETEEPYYQEMWDGSVSEPAYNADTKVYTVNCGAELAWVAQEVNNGRTFIGETILLNKDINLNNELWTPIGNSAKHSATFRGSFDGQGNTIYNLFAQNEEGTGLFGLVSPLEIKNVNIDGATVNSTHYGAALVGWIQGVDSNHRCTISNCHVKNAVVTLEVKDKDNGDKAAALAGYAVRTDITGCSVENVVVKAYRDCAALVGHANTGAVVKNCSATNATVIVDQTVEYATEAAANAGKIVGRKSDDAVVENNTSENVVIKSVVNTNEAFETALAAGESVILGADLNVGSLTLSKDTSIEGVTKDITLTGNLIMQSAYAGGQYTSPNITLSNLTFKWNGQGRNESDAAAILILNEGSGCPRVTLDNCVFDWNGGNFVSYMKNAAGFIFAKNYAYGLIVRNCKFTGSTGNNVNYDIWGGVTGNDSVQAVIEGNTFAKAVCIENGTAQFNNIVIRSNSVSNTLRGLRLVAQSGNSFKNIWIENNTVGKMDFYGWNASTVTENLYYKGNNKALPANIADKFITEY